MARGKPKSKSSSRKTNPKKNTGKKANPKKKTKTQKTLSRIGGELKKNPPAILAKTRAKEGEAAAEAQREAILLSKARKAGANIPKRSKPKRR